MRPPQKSLSVRCESRVRDAYCGSEEVRKGLGRGVSECCPSRQRGGTEPEAGATISHNAEEVHSFGKGSGSEQLARRGRKTGECRSSSVRDNSKKVHGPHAGESADGQILGQSQILSSPLKNSDTQLSVNDAGSLISYIILCERRTCYRRLPLELKRELRVFLAFTLGVLDLQQVLTNQRKLSWMVTTR